MCALLLLASCAAPPPEIVESEEVTDTVEVAEEEADPGFLSIRFGSEGRVFGAAKDFAHESHAEIVCASCHENPVGHNTHTDVECVDCHPSVSVEAPVAAPSPGECLSCHHGPTQGLECADCHTPQDTRGEGSVTVRVSMSVLDAPQERRLPFEHVRHEGEDCTACHGGETTLAPPDDCSSCHEEHHQPEADCLTCHQEIEGDAHGPEAHRGCAGTGCHEDPVTNALPFNRVLCLSCHEEQVDHETQGECVECHAVGSPR